ncbi:MAG TPA: hypothetical protein DD412_02465 [Holosporales bacterium]|nr:hypothetical protein [Holosporales bacterium]
MVKNPCFFQTLANQQKETRLWSLWNFSALEAAHRYLKTKLEALRIKANITKKPRVQSLQT